MHHQPDGTAGPPDLDKGPEMTATHRTTTAARIGQCVAATALMAGLAFGAAATAGAEREWDLAQNDKCIEDNWPPGNYTLEQLDTVFQYCCITSGGVWNASTSDCNAPPPEAENVPGEPGQPTPPSVLQNPPAQPSNPLIPTPRGPNSDTLAP
jgi:hypothetical protein